MAGDKIKNANDKGKSLATSKRKPLDLARTVVKEQDKLVLDSTRRFLPGGMDRGESSRQQETTNKQKAPQQQETTKLQTAKQKIDKARDTASAVKNYQQGINKWMHKKHQSQDLYNSNETGIETAYQGKLSEANDEYKRNIEDKLSDLSIDE